jgi:hypothetical protein
VKNMMAAQPNDAPTVILSSRQSHAALRRRHAELSSTAVCLAGQTREFASPVLREMQLRNLIHPLQGDLFLVLSQQNAGVMGDRSSFEPRYTRLSEKLMADLRRQVDPISIVVARDDQMGEVLRQVHLPPQELDEIEDCIRIQPLPTNRVHRGGDDWKGWFQIGPCAPQLSLALRHRVCLGLIELAERERGGIPYNWVVRSRPDIALPCALPVSVLRPAMVSYNRRCCGVDFIAVMPRAAADTVLREVPLARRHQISDCFSYRDGNDAGKCNMALTRRANFSLGFLEGRVWNPNEDRFIHFEHAIKPVRSKDSGNGKLDEESLYKLDHTARHELGLFPAVPFLHDLPFANVSKADHNGSALVPDCWLVESETLALATRSQNFNRIPLPYLYREVRLHGQHR